MPKGKIPSLYKYKTGDTPITVASQFGTTPDQLLAANQGGTPFSIGQTIEIPGVHTVPYSYSSNVTTPTQQTATPGPFGRGPSPAALQHAQELAAPPSPTMVAPWAGATPIPNVQAPTSLAPTTHDTTDYYIQQVANGRDISSLPDFVQQQILDSLKNQGMVDQNATLADFTGAGNTQQQQGGSAPFGVNAQGQRLDANGNVWNPNTATTDIYGGRFQYAGQTRWAKNKKGRTVKQYLNNKNQWVTITGGGKKKATNTNASANANDTSGFTGFGVVNFGAGAG